MKYSKNLARLTLPMALLLGSFPFAANAALIELTFQQDGFAGGGVLEARLVVEDGDGDGRISSFTGEVESLALQLIGNLIFSARPIVRSGTEVDFVYDLDGGPLGDSVDEGLRATIDDVGYLTGFGTLSGMCSGERLCAEYFGPARSIFSSSPLSLVNEPELGLFTALLGIAWLRRRVLA